MSDPEGSGAGRGPIRRAIAALAITQVTGWGTTYYLPAVLAPGISAGTGLSVEMVFGGVSIMLVVSALAGPVIGRLLSRDGARRWMMTGSAVIAIGLLILAAAHGPVAFVAAWIVIGLGVPVALGQAASTAMVEIAPGEARRAITIVFLFSGISSTVCWPILIALDGALGWRGSLLVYAAFHLLVCLPLHAVGLPRPAPRGETRGGPPPNVPAAGAEREHAPVPGAFALAAICFSLAGFVSWGLPLHLIGMLRDLGHSEASAVAIGALLGPGQLAARVFDILGGHRFGILTVGIIALLVLPASLALALVGGSSTVVAVAFVLLYGTAAGTLSIVRAVAPLRLFGRAQYPIALGRLALPQNIVFAASPVVLAAARTQFGAAGVAWVALLAGLVSLAALVVLARRAARQDALMSGER